MAMDSLLPISFLLFTFFSVNFVSSNASELSYKDHCASMVSESTPIGIMNDDGFPFGQYHSGYYTGGKGIFGVDPSWHQKPFVLKTRNILSTEQAGLFKIDASLTFRTRSTDSYYYAGEFSYYDSSYYGQQRPYRKGLITIRLDGFWSESSGKLCIVGTGKAYSKEGNLLDLDAVFKLNNVANSSNIASLVIGSLESLSSKNHENYFEPISVLMLPKMNYKYTLSSVKTGEFSSGGDAVKGLSANSFNLCSRWVSRGLEELRLEYSSDSILQRIALLLTFNPNKMLVGEGWWDEKKNQLCVVACHFMGITESLASAHVGDCSVRLRLTVPAIWSINDASSIVGKIWSNKTVNDLGYFKKIMFRNDDDNFHGVTGLKYEYSQQQRVESLCPRRMNVKNEENMYPSAYSSDMKFDMSAGTSKKRVISGHATPLSVGDRFYQLDLDATSDSESISTTSIPVANFNASGLYNISYRMSITIFTNSTSKSSVETMKIVAEGLYDADTGSLCMVGCRNLQSIARSVDCKILVKFQFPPLDSNKRSYIKGSIVSKREKSDRLYFNPLNLSSAAFTTEEASKTVWRMDMEIIMALISTTLACVFIGWQLYYVKRQLNALPFISLVMLSILILGQTMHLVLNFEALFTESHNSKNFLLGNVGWLEVNEITLRLTTMVAFLLQFRLLQLTWSARKADGSQKSLWIAERKVFYITLVLYAAGFLAVFLLRWKKNGDEILVSFSGYSYQNPSMWEGFKSYGGLVLDGFLLPQIMLNLFSNLRENALSSSYYFGTTFLRLLPHAYDLYRVHNYARQDNGASYYYADPRADFYSTVWDIVIPLVALLFSLIIYLQQRFGGRCILPRRFKGSAVYERVAMVSEETEGEKPDI
ncbi:hypothetical protein L6164_018450 [Bauhinia variegata]|uniref:Uncharacterized protein n=1 Tax=Bauhinia variegata TaxID=167791 RepID=A0ACB9NB76_BAUVA|nr:hypothetical protein L6164_018450 [Bauhinia variegata]